MASFWNDSLAHIEPDTLFSEGRATIGDETGKFTDAGFEHLDEFSLFGSRVFRPDPPPSSDEITSSSDRYAASADEGSFDSYSTSSGAGGGSVANYSGTYPTSSGFGAGSAILLLVFIILTGLILKSNSVRNSTSANAVESPRSVSEPISSATPTKPYNPREHYIVNPLKDLRFPWEASSTTHRGARTTDGESEFDQIQREVRESIAASSMPRAGRISLISVMTNSA